MLKNIKTFVKINGKPPKNLKVKVHQDSVSNPLLLAVEVDEITKEIREGNMKELLYTDHNWGKLGRSKNEICTIKIS